MQIKSWDDLIWQDFDSGLRHLIQTESSRVNLPDLSGEYVLERAAFHQRTDLVEKLLSSGAYPNQLDDLGQLPLHSALVYYEDEPEASFAIVKLLLDHGADIEKRGYPDFTALHRACLANAFDIVKLLLDHGAEINARSEDRGDGGRTALDIAEMYKHQQIVHYLRLKGGKNA